MKPYFLQEPDDITAMDGEDILLECEVGGDPNPTVLWHREDGSLPHGRTRCVLTRFRPVKKKLKCPILYFALVKAEDIKQTSMLSCVVSDKKELYLPSIKTIL